MWVAVAEIHASDGHGPNERAWAKEMFGYLRTEGAARGAAVLWFSDTDQARACDVTFSVERPGGTIVAHRIVVGPEIVARPYREK
jgi:hypothetical protein